MTTRVWNDVKLPATSRAHRVMFEMTINYNDHAIARTSEMTVNYDDRAIARISETTLNRSDWAIARTSKTTLNSGPRASARVSEMTLNYGFGAFGTIICHDDKLSTKCTRTTVQKDVKLLF